MQASGRWDPAFKFVTSSLTMARSGRSGASTVRSLELARALPTGGKRLASHFHFLQLAYNNHNQETVSVYEPTKQISR